MKQFFKYVLATVTGLVVVGILMSFLSFFMLISMALSSPTPSVKPNSVMVVKLDGTIVERAENNPFAELLGDASIQTLGLDNLLTAFDKAKANDDIKGVYLEAGMLAGVTPAMLQELRDAIVDFKESGKFVVAYGDTYTQGAYYLCSAADSVIINPQGMLEWTGMATQSMHFKDLLDKLGVKVQVFKVGTYKSAVEPFILNEMSDANREQMSVFCHEIWGQMLADVSESRNVAADKLNALADTAVLFCETKMYKEVNLVDKLAYSDEVPKIISNMMELDEDTDYNTITVKDMLAVESSDSDGEGEVAVYYAFGDIVDRASSYGASQEIVSTKVIRDLKKLADDDNVKAVVLRVNSGGGSAYASEQIWHQVMNIKAKKPIVVSMGGMAASGGYYISCAADCIVAEPTTLTGSIGIFGMIPEVSELVNEKLGVRLYSVKTNKFGDFGDLTRPMNSSEKAVMQGYVNRGYELFTQRCADGRGMLQDSIKAVGEGRVWTGEHAKALGLVDVLGGLDDAIAIAREKAGAADSKVVSYPAAPSILDQFVTTVSSGSYADGQLRNIMGDYYEIFNVVKRVSEKSSVEASVPYRYTFNL